MTTVINLNYIYMLHTGTFSIPLFDCKKTKLIQQLITISLSYNIYCQIFMLLLSTRGGVNATSTCKVPGYSLGSASVLISFLVPCPMKYFYKKTPTSFKPRETAN